MSDPGVAVALYTDGGVVGASRTKVGGSWAYCHVNADGQRIKERGGFLIPSAVWAGDPNPQDNVTSPVMELIALCRGIRSLPEGWQGTIYCDCQSALIRVFENAAMNGVPHKLIAPARSVASHLGNEVYRVLLAGHPTKADLAQGYKIKPGDPRRWPVSEHNVWCDAHCNAWKKMYVSTQAWLTHGTQDPLDIVAAYAGTACMVCGLRYDQHHGGSWAKGVHVLCDGSLVKL